MYNVYFSFFESKTSIQWRRHKVQRNVILESHLAEAGKTAEHDQRLRNHWQNSFALSFNKDLALGEIIIGYITPETYVPESPIPLRSHIRRKEKDFEKAKQGHRRRADWQKWPTFPSWQENDSFFFHSDFSVSLEPIICFYCSLCCSDLYLLKSPPFKICCTVLRNNTGLQFYNVLTLPINNVFSHASFIFLNPRHDLQKEMSTASHVSSLVIFQCWECQ